MIKLENLYDFCQPVRCKDGEGITLNLLQNILANKAAEFGLPVAFKYDQVKSGGLFKSSVEDCLVLYHPEHEKDYYNFCIRASHQGIYAFVNVSIFGTSKLSGNADSHAYLMDTLKNGRSNAEKVGALIGAGARRLIKGGRNSLKLEQEQQYYACMSDLFAETIA